MHYTSTPCKSQKGFARSTTTHDTRNFAMDIYGSDWYGRLASGAAIEFYVLKVKQIVRLQHGPS